MSDFNAYTIYLTEQNWARIIAYAWSHPEFQDQLEKNPTTAIKYLQENNPAFKGIKFDLIAPISPRPVGVSDEELWQVVNGEITVIPDRFVRAEDGTVVYP